MNSESILNFARIIYFVLSLLLFFCSSIFSVIKLQKYQTAVF